MSQFSLPQELLAELDLVDAIVRERIAARATVLQLAGHHIAPEETRIRAALTLLGAQLGPRPNAEAARHAAATVELIYAASYVHDSLMDNAANQREQTGAGNHWHDDVSLMVGDYLFALAASEMALAPDSRIIVYFSQAVMAICEGQLAPVMALTPLQDALQHYFSTIGNISAALFKAACQAGVVCGGGAQAQIDALGDYGYQIGMAVQIIADVRGADNRSNEGTIAGPTITLPQIYAANATQDDATHHALADANSAIERALAALKLVPASAAQQTLASIARAVLQTDDIKN